MALKYQGGPRGWKALLKVHLFIPQQLKIFPFVPGGIDAGTA